EKQHHCNKRRQTASASSSSSTIILGNHEASPKLWRLFAALHSGPTRHSGCGLVWPAALSGGRFGLYRSSIASPLCGSRPCWALSRSVLRRPSSHRRPSRRARPNTGLRAESLLAGGCSDHLGSSTTPWLED